MLAVGIASSAVVKDGPSVARLSPAIEETSLHGKVAVVLAAAFVAVGEASLGTEPSIAVLYDSGLVKPLAADDIVVSFAMCGGRSIVDGRANANASVDVESRSEIVSQDRRGVVAESGYKQLGVTAATAVAATAATPPLVPTSIWNTVRNGRRRQ